MYMQISNPGPQQAYNENVCWLVEKQEFCKPRYKSPFAAKVKWDNWIAKNGCCRTMGPPPHFSCSCPEHFLKKHTRNVPVFFSREDLRNSKRLNKQDENQQHNKCCCDLKRTTKRAAPLDTGLPNHRMTIGEGDCPFHKPPSRMGLFRGPGEESYEKKYGIRRGGPQCNCDDKSIIEDLVNAAKCAGAMAANLEIKQKEKDVTKDFIRSNALKAVRMPPRRMKRCYQVNDMHLVDMSDSPYVLRPGFGKVPPYLYRRKLELIDGDIQYKKRLGEEATQDFYAIENMEKDAVLDGLKNYLEDLIAQYNSFPINENNNLNKIREAKESIEGRIKEVERDIRMLHCCGPLFVGNVDKSHYL